MRVHTKILSLLTYCAILFFCSFLAINTANAARVVIGVGTHYGPNVVYVPGHWYRGYWVPGQYVEYAGPPPGAGYVWVQGGHDGRHGWRHGHWRRHHHH